MGDEDVGLGDVLKRATTYAGKKRGGSGISIWKVTSKLVSIHLLYLPETFRKELALNRNNISENSDDHSFLNNTIPQRRNRCLPLRTRTRGLHPVLAQH